MPSARPVITLTTDYGTSDHLVGVMKGVILSINPEVQIVDITHGVPKVAAAAATATGADLDVSFVVTPVSGSASTATTEKIINGVGIQTR